MADREKTSIDFQIDLHVKGLEKAKSDIISIFKNMPTLEKNFAGDAFKTQLTQLNKLKDNTFSYYEKLSKLIEKKNSIEAAMSEDTSGVGDEAKLIRQQNELDKLMPKIYKYIGLINTNVSSFKALEQASFSTFAAMKNGAKKAIADMKKYGASQKEVTAMTKQLRDAEKESRTSNNKNAVRDVARDLETRAGLMQKLNSYQEKLNASKLDDVTLTQKLKEIEATKTNVMDPKKSTGELKRKTQDLSAGISEITKKEKEFRSQINKVNSDLDRQIEKLKKEIALSKAKYEEEKNSATAAAKSGMTKNINSMVTRLKEYQQKKREIQNIDLVSKESADRANADVKKITKSVENLSDKASTVRIHLELSGGTDKVRGALSSITQQIKDLSKTSTGIGKSNELIKFTKQIEEQQKKLNSGSKKDVTNAKAFVVEAQKRINLYQELTTQAEILERRALGYGRGMENAANTTRAVAQELRAAAASQLDMGKNASELGVIIKNSQTKAKQLNTSLMETEAVEKKLIKLAQSYENELGTINRLKNAKSRTASEKDLKEATAFAKKLEEELKRVKLLLDKIRTEKNSVNIDDGSVARVKREAEQLNTRLAETKHRAKEIKTALAGMSGGKWLKNIAQRAVAYAGLYAGIYQVINVLRRGVTAVVEFDTQVRTMAAVFDISTVRAKALGYELIGLAKAWGGSVTDINSAAMALGRAGIATDKVTEATEIVVKMARLTGDSIAVSANAMITYQQVFGKTHPILKELGDQLAYVANQSRMSTQDIGTFSNYALATASAAGITLESINAIAVAFSNAGVNASTSGTQLRRFASLLKDNSTSAQEFFLKMGTSQEIFSNRLKESSEESNKAMAELITKLKNLSGTEFSKAVAGMDILASNSITLLRNNADEYLRHFQALSAGVQGEIDKANLISESYAGSFEKLSASAGEAFQRITEGLAPTIQSAMDNLTAGFQWISDNGTQAIDAVTNSLRNLLAMLALIKAQAVFGVMVSSFTGIGKILTRLVSIIRTVIVAFGIYKTSMFAAVGATAKLGVVTEYLRGAFTLLASHPIIRALTILAAVGFGVYEAFSTTEEATKKLNTSQERYKETVEQLKKKDKELADAKMDLVRAIEEQRDADTESARTKRINAEILVAAIEKEKKALKKSSEEALAQQKASTVEADISVIKRKIEIENDPQKMEKNWVEIARLEKQLEILQSKKIL